MTLNLSSPCFGKDWGYKHVLTLCCRFVKIHLSIGKFLQTFSCRQSALHILGLHMGESKQPFLICPAKPSIPIVLTMAII